MTPAGELLLIGLLLAILLVVIFLLYRQTAQRRQLQHWLADPLTHEIPEGRGSWREVFSQLQRLRKEESRARTALGGSLDRFHQAAQALPDGVILLDTGGYIEWLNHAATEHFGFDPARDVGTLVEQLIRQSAFHAFLEAFRAGQEIKPLTLQVDTVGTRRTLSILLISFADTGILLLSRDISEIARAEAMRRDFIANVSHELRTPLTVISGFLEQLTSEPAPSDESFKGFLTLMAEQAQRMNRLVEDLLTLSRLESTAEPPRQDTVDVPALIDLLANEARVLSNGRHVIELEALAACKLCGSCDEIRSAFGNLISNAIRYTPAGGRIRLAWECDAERLCFVVSDTGIGIPQEHIPRLTERFYRVDKGRSTNSGGTGLGLAIVKHVLARHQGALMIRSKIGEGSVFMACLPAERKIDH
jgi:two-component system phosphate regulon sensor histidine kinase PhoR